MAKHGSWRHRAHCPVGEVVGNHQMFSPRSPTSDWGTFTLTGRAENAIEPRPITGLQRKHNHGDMPYMVIFKGPLHQMTVCSILRAMWVCSDMWLILLNLSKWVTIVYSFVHIFTHQVGVFKCRLNIFSLNLFQFMNIHFKYQPSLCWMTDFTQTDFWSTFNWNIQILIADLGWSWSGATFWFWHFQGLPEDFGCDFPKDFGWRPEGLRDHTSEHTPSPVIWRQNRVRRSHDVRVYPIRVLPHITSFANHAHSGARTHADP